MSTTMKALVTAEGKTAFVQDIPIPQPGQGEILIKVHYIAQNPTDWKAMAASPPGRIIGCDFAGTVEDPNSSHWRKSQRVAGFVQGTSVNPTRGAFTEYAVVESSLVFPIPDETTYQSASVIPLAFATAVQALYQRLALPEPSKRATSPFPVLINGGTSSVGQYAVQLAKASNLFVIATGSPRNHALLTSLGADAVIDYTDPQWPSQVQSISHSNLHHAFDCISEPHTTPRVAEALSPTKGGHIVTILPRKPSEFSSPDLASRVKLESTIVYTVFERPLRYGAFDNCNEGPTPKDKAHWEKWLAMLPDLLEKGTIKPNKVKELGEIEKLIEGFDLQKQGKVSAEKLVYRIA